MAENPDRLFWENVERRYVDIAAQISHAQENKVSSTAKSGYYRAAIILACTIVEGLLYKLVQSKAPSNIINEVKRYKHPHSIPGQYSEKNLVLCIEEKETVVLSTQTTFNELIKLCRSKSWLSANECNRLDSVKKLRNRIHLQSLQTEDRNYTKTGLEKVFKVVIFLSEKLGRG